MAVPVLTGSKCPHRSLVGFMACGKLSSADVLCFSGAYLGCQDDPFNFLQTWNESLYRAQAVDGMAYAGTGTWIHGYMDRWMRWGDGGMVMDVCMHACTHVCMSVYISHMYM